MYTFSERSYHQLLVGRKILPQKPNTCALDPIMLISGPLAEIRQKTCRYPKTSKWDSFGSNEYFLTIFFLFFKLDQGQSGKQPQKAIKQVIKNGVW